MYGQLKSQYLLNVSNVRVKMFTIYSKENCSNCEKAKVLLYMRGLPFEVKKLDTDFDISWYMGEFKVRSFPVIVNDTKVYKSFEELQNSI